MELGSTQQMALVLVKLLTVIFISFSMGIQFGQKSGEEWKGIALKNQHTAIANGKTADKFQSITNDAIETARRWKEMCEASDERFRDHIDNLLCHDIVERIKIDTSKDMHLGGGYFLQIGDEILRLKKRDTKGGSGNCFSLLELVDGATVKFDEKGEGQIPVRFEIIEEAFVGKR